MATLYPVQTTVPNGKIFDGSYAKGSSPEYFIDMARPDNSGDGLSTLTAFKNDNGLYAVLPAISTNGDSPIVNFMASQTGSAASIVAGAAAGNVRVTGLTGMEAVDVGGSLQLAKCATAANNIIGTIVVVNSPTSVDIINAAGVVGDANNGAIYWNKAHIAPCLYWLGGNGRIPGVRWRGPKDMVAFPTQTGPATAALDVAPVTELSLLNALGISTPCRTQLNFVTAAPGWAVDDMACRASVRIKDAAGNLKYFETPIARNTANTLIIDTLLYRVSGIAASIVAGAAAGSMRVSGLVGMTAADVGNTLALANSASGGNVGLFPISVFVNATTVDVINAAAVVPDANNGKIYWWDLPVDRILSTDTVEIVWGAARLSAGTNETEANQIFLGGAASSNTSTGGQNPKFGHAFEKLVLPFINSHALIDRDFDRCFMAGALLTGGQFSFNNVASRGGQWQINTPSNPPTQGGCRPDGIPSPSRFTATVSAAAGSASVLDASTWPASGKLRAGSGEISSYTRVGNVITFVGTRGIDGTAAALQNQFTVVYPITAPLNEAPQVQATCFGMSVSNIVQNPFRPYGAADWSVQRPFSLWQSVIGNASAAAIGMAGASGYLTQSSGAAIMGDCVTANRTFLRARLAYQVVLDPALFFGIGNGTGGDLQLETGPAIKLGVGAGQFMEADGFNGNFFRSSAGSPGAPLGDASRIGTQLEITTDIDFPTVQTAVFTAKIGRLHRLNPTGGAFAVNLPAIGSFNKGQRIDFKNSSASTNAITVTPNGGNTIDGAANLVMNVARQAVALVSDGVGNWEVI